MRIDEASSLQNQLYPALMYLGGAGDLGDSSDTSCDVPEASLSMKLLFRGVSAG